MSRIEYIQYTNPAAYPSLEHSSRILATKGWEVLFLGTGSFGADALEFPLHERITVKRMKFCSGGWRQKFHYLRFMLWVLWWTLRWQPQWIYASDPLSCPIALLLSFFPGLRVIYHEHDSPDTADSVFMRWVLWSRRKLAQRATLCILPNEQRTQYFSLSVANGRPVITVWNCPSLEEISPQRVVRDERVIYLWYHGSIVPSQLPVTVIHALAKLPEYVKLYMAGYETVGHVGYVRKLKGLAERLGVGHRVEYLGTLSTREELFRECRKADIGLALFTKPTNQPMVGASNKPFDYLACGLALLVSDLPDWQKMYVEPGYGLACDPDDPDSIAQAIRWFLDHPDEMRAMGERGRQRILDEWNYEKQFMPVLKHLYDKLYE